MSFCQLVLGLVFIFFRASLFIYLFIIIVMLCVSFFEFILNNLIQHQFYGFAATPGGLSAGSGGEGRQGQICLLTHTHTLASINRPTC